MLLLPERLLIDQFKTVIYIDSIQLWPKMLISHVVGSEIYENTVILERNS